MPIPPEKIIQLAERGGFASELKTSSLLSLGGWHPSQSVYYLDKDQRLGRELDIYAYRSFSDRTDNPKLSCQIDLCIEVKRTAEPFIFFSSKANAYEGGSGYGLFRWSHNIDNRILDFRDIELSRPFARRVRLARSYSSFKDGKTQQIRSGIVSSFKAAIHYTERCNERWNDDSRDICFFVPILLVDGEIYECYFKDGDENLTVESGECVPYLQNYVSPEYGMLSNTVYVMTLGSLSNNLKLYEDWGNSILSTLKATKAKPSREGQSRGGISPPYSQIDG